MAELRDWEGRRLQTVQHWCPQPDWVPRPFSSGEAYVLLFFSGHRRDGDIATWVAQLGNVTPICIDLAIDPDAGNVLSDDIWMRLIRARRVRAAHAGPPCETYTEARWLELPGQQGPRPLRSATHPWCMPQRREKEVRQCHIGTILFLQAVKLLMLTWAHGGAITLEHPRGPQSAELRWCIWFSAFLRQWLLAPGVYIVQFLQGPLGQISAKPTTLLVGRLPGLAARLFAAYQKGWKATASLGGKDSQGAWKTARAKEYPTALCKVLAEEFVTFATSQPEEDFDALTPEVHEMLAKLQNWDPYLTDGSAGVMAADYHPDAYK
eukprot:Skav225033  [mRNA]  locus=scaffold2061:194267:195232:+ [translate_table: standard]